MRSWRPAGRCFASARRTCSVGRTRSSPRFSGHSAGEMCEVAPHGDRMGASVQISRGTAVGSARAGTLVGVSRVVVDVVLKPEISDPQGQAVLGALGRLGHSGVTSVRQGKHFVLEVDGTPDEAELKQIAETLLANPVIEDVELHLPTD